MKYSDFSYLYAILFISVGSIMIWVAKKFIDRTEKGAILYGWAGGIGFILLGLIHIILRSFLYLRDL